MPNPTGCLRLAHSALKPGGRIALSVWGKPERNPWIALPVMVLRKYVDIPTPQPGEPGILAFADGDPDGKVSLSGCQLLAIGVK